MIEGATMKRIVTYVVISLLTVTCVSIINSLRARRRHHALETSASRAERVAITAPVPTAAVTPTPDLEVAFGSHGMKLVPDEVHLASDRRHYEINVSYPQVDGSDDVYVRRLNQRIKELVTANYRWPLTITDEELRRSLEMHPEPTNTVDIIYDVSLASDSMLSIYFAEYSYGIGAAHGVQQSFVLNYDLVAKEELKLSDLFAPGSKYLRFISRYCTEELTRDGHASTPFPESLTPVSRNFASWNATPTGIRFNFDQCRVFGCSAPQQEVEIPFSDLKPILSSRAVSIWPISSVVKGKADKN
jgi:hypothetical protein